METWIDTSACPNTYHRVMRDEDGRPVALHEDDTTCEDCEFGITN